MSESVSASDIPRGFTFAATHCGLKKSKLDLASDRQRNSRRGRRHVHHESRESSAGDCFASASSKIAQQNARRDRQFRQRELLHGLGRSCAASTATALKVARELGSVHPSQILVCSTGVIGVPLRVEKILDAVPQLVRSRRAGPGCFDEVTRAIMTTDTRPKWAAAKCRIGGKAGPNSRLRQGLRHDHAEYGDDARLPRDGCSNRACIALASAARVVPEKPSIASPWMATHPRTTRSPCSPTANPAREKSSARGSDYKKFCAALESVCKVASALRSFPTEKARSA